MGPDAADSVVTPPEIAVVVPSHDRPLRLRWLLNALQEQTLAPERFEVVIVHDSAGPETDELLRTVPLAQLPGLRALGLKPGSALAGGKRNLGWRSARAPLIAFTDDDCRPPPQWLERALAAAHANPGAIVQGATRPDPDERDLLHRAPRAHSQEIDPPTLWSETCNIVYPRAGLERVGGFGEGVLTGEDSELGARARAAGIAFVAAPEVLTYHAVATPALSAHLRSLRRWGDMPWAVKRQPSLRTGVTLGVFWKPTHASLPLAAAAAILSRRHAAWALLALPWVIATWPPYGSSPRGRLRSLTELPGKTLSDLVEFAVLVRGSLRHRSLLL